MMQGILIVDKPTDWTSFDVIAKLRGILGTRKLGHSGTLDPMATGVLPVFCGGASKAVDLQLDHTKAYRAVLRLGQRTDTGDVTGTVLETAPVTAGGAGAAGRSAAVSRPPGCRPRPCTRQSRSTASRSISWPVRARPWSARPGRSRFWTSGTRAALRKMSMPLTVKCSKGTYIRVLLEEIAEAMGQKGTMSALRRVAAGVYSEADAHTLEEIQAAKDAGPEALQARCCQWKACSPACRCWWRTSGWSSTSTTGAPPAAIPLPTAATACGTPEGSFWVLPMW